MLDEKLSSLKQRYEELTHLLSQPETLQDSSKYRKLTLEHSDLEETVSTYSKLINLCIQIRDNEALVGDPNEEIELKELALEEMKQLCSHAICFACTENTQKTLGGGFKS